MARVTVEDCVDKVPNRFELVMLAAHRAREISAGAPITVDRDNDKNPVVSLREIEARIVPTMRGAEYLGPAYDSTAMAYRLKFIRDGRVLFVDVDARTGRVLGRSD